MWFTLKTTKNYTQFWTIQPIFTHFERWQSDITVQPIFSEFFSKKGFTTRFSTLLGYSKMEVHAILSAQIFKSLDQFFPFDEKEASIMY